MMKVWMIKVMHIKTNHEVIHYSGHHMPVILHFVATWINKLAMLGNCCPLFAAFCCINRAAG